MKRLLPLLLIVLIPQVAFAAWWNPFSWGIFYNRTSKTEVLEGVERKLQDDIQVSKPVGSSLKTNASKTIEKIPLDKMVSSEINSGVSSKDMIDTIDIMIKNKQSYVDSINEYLEIVNYYHDWAQGGVRASQALINIENDGYLMGMWKFYKDVFGLIEEYSQQLIDGNGSSSEPNLLSNLINKSIKELEQIKRTTPQFYANKNALEKDLLELLEIDSYNTRKIIDEIYKAKKSYLNLVGIAMTKISDTESDVESHMSRSQRKYDSVNYTRVYQQPTVTQIQMPKTTYCTMSSTYGANYSIICN